MTIKDCNDKFEEFYDKARDMLEEIDIYTVQLPDGIYDLIDEGFKMRNSTNKSNVDDLNFDPFYIIRNFECWLDEEHDTIRIHTRNGKKVEDITSSFDLSDDDLIFLGQCKEFRDIAKELYDAADEKLDQIAGYIVNLYLKRFTDTVKTLQSNRSLVESMTKLLQDYKRLHKDSMSSSIEYIHGVLSLYETVYGVKPGGRSTLKDHDPWKGKPVPTRGTSISGSRPKPAEFSHTKPALK